MSRRICFLGDSITHANFFVGHLYDFFLMRYPHWRIDLINCGIAGDRASFAVSRLGYDVLAYDPDTVVIMFGMNDIDRDLYFSVSQEQGILKARKDAIRVFKESLEKIVIELSLLKADLILVTPTPYDQITDTNTHNNYGCNDALKECSDITKIIASKYNLRIVDLYSPMTSTLERFRKDRSVNAIIETDRVHPNEKGVLMMTYLFLVQMGVSAKIAAVKLDYEGRELPVCTNCEIRNVSACDERLTYEYKPFSYPFYSDELYMDLNRSLQLTEDLNREICIYNNLPIGDYRMIMNGNHLGDYSSASLQKGINIADNKNNPGQIYAKEVHMINVKRFEWEQKFRTIRFVEYEPRRKGIDPHDENALRSFLKDSLEEIIYKPYYDYCKNCILDYFSLKPDEDIIIKQIENLQDELHEMNLHHDSNVLVQLVKI